MHDFSGTVTILAPIIRKKKKGTYEQLFKELNADGFIRVRVDGQIYRTDDEIKLGRQKSFQLPTEPLPPYKNFLDGFRVQYLKAVGEYLGFSMTTPISELTDEQYAGLMYGTEDAKIQFKQSSRNADFLYHGTWEGLLPQVKRLYGETKSEHRKTELEKFMRILPCPTCHGKRLKESVLAVKIADKSIADVTDLSIDDALIFFDHLTLSKKEEDIARLILREIHSRLVFLQEVGIGIPDAFTQCRFIIWRRSTAYPACYPDRIESDGCIIYSG
ncbi:unnamed protein product [Cylicocyclus nassatus]|uniref:UvrA DNA-binding domain-containing protein n=1 Tax=Cylicocyclus nassatus TaxID=53992 RepID=A0AA36GYJ7_CYLNA|nr:unnamed protein product [Cylicocyclus nassatus]